jgi:formylglycine-generating enzyme required for sulfatase activity
MSRATLLVPSLLLVLPSASCEGPAISREHDIVDTPQPVPTKIPAPTPPPPDPSQEDPMDPKGCGRGTGRNDTGECETLRTRDLGHVQQVQLPAGRFVMGDIPRDYATAIGRVDPRERWSGQPPRYAQAPAFWIDLHEVTRETYAKCVDEGKCTPAECPDGSDPVDKFPPEAAAVVPQTCVTHEQAAAFCAVHGGRLPTEVEWEYAARGPDARLYPWGNDLRDEYTAMLMPVTASIGDMSYFGLRGMGTSAIEWVADAYEIDVGLRDFVHKPFRRADGPLRRAEATRGKRFVMKGGKVGLRRDSPGADRRLGFRCAADLGPGETGLAVPAEAPAIPLLRNAGSGLLVFGGVAEAVDRREAEAFCAVLRVEHQGQTYEGWRLPTLAEVEAIHADFRGPGPFWAADGAVVQKGGGKGGPGEPWIPDEAATDGDALAARCVRDATPPATPQ